MSEPADTHAAIRAKLADLGYTPSVRDVPALVAYAAEPDADDKAVLRALVRIGPALATAAATHVQTTPRVAPLLLRAIGKAGRQSGWKVAEVKRYFLPLLDSDEPRTRREAIVQLGKCCEVDAELEDLLLARLLNPHDDAERRALTDALGKVGSHKAYEALRASGHARGAVMASRNSARGDGGVALDVSLADSVLVAFRTRRGVERVLRTELRARFGLMPEKTYPGLLLVRGLVSLRAALELRTWVDVGIAHLAQRAELADALRALGPVLSAHSEGAATYRLDLPKASRGQLWAQVEKLATVSTLQNDPKAAVWELRSEPGLPLTVAWAKKIDDARFAYRVADVPASSHPTIAAALAHVGGADDGDKVWDPFVGAGLELAERARLGPYAKLMGTDLEHDALDAAEANLVGLRHLELNIGDSFRHDPGPVHLIISNPPMGRRVRRDGDLAADLVGFLSHASKLLVPGGRLVWLSPFPEETAQAARARRLDLEMAFAVDLGGYDVELQRMIKRA